MAKPPAGAPVVSDGWAAGCVAAPSLRCMCFTPMKVKALISSTTRTTPVTLRGAGGRCRDRLGGGTVLLRLTLNTFTAYGGNRTPGLDCHQCRGTVNLG